MQFIKKTMFNTFNGWKAKGRVVMAGEKSQYKNQFNDGMFHRSQTCLKNGVETITVYRDKGGRFIRQTTTIRQG